MPKQLLFKEKPARAPARRQRHRARGQVTLGAEGRNVVLDRSTAARPSPRTAWPSPRRSAQGPTRTWAQMIKEVASKTSDLAGTGPPPPPCSRSHYAGAEERDGGGEPHGSSGHRAAVEKVVEELSGCRSPRRQEGDRQSPPSPPTTTRPSSLIAEPWRRGKTASSRSKSQGWRPLSTSSRDAVRSRLPVSLHGDDPAA